MNVDWVVINTAPSYNWLKVEIPEASRTRYQKIQDPWGKFIQDIKSDFVLHLAIHILRALEATTTNTVATKRLEFTIHHSTTWEKQLGQILELPTPVLEYFNTEKWKSSPTAKVSKIWCNVYYLFVKVIKLILQLLPESSFII